MATGMPIATLRHPTSPIRDGLEGVVAETAEELREKVLSLLENQTEAVRMGQGARIRVGVEFPLSDFREAWNAFAKKLLYAE